VKKEENGKREMSDIIVKGQNVYKYHTYEKRPMSRQRRT
jgi:hypothetical protein